MRIVPMKGLAQWVLSNSYLLSLTLKPTHFIFSFLKHFIKVWFSLWFSKFSKRKMAREFYEILSLEILHGFQLNLEVTPPPSNSSIPSKWIKKKKSIDLERPKMREETRKQGNGSDNGWT